MDAHHTVMMSSPMSQMIAQVRYLRNSDPFLKLLLSFNWLTVIELAASWMMQKIKSSLRQTARQQLHKRDDQFLNIALAEERRRETKQSKNLRPCKNDAIENTPRKRPANLLPLENARPTSHRRSGATQRQESRGCRGNSRPEALSKRGGTDTPTSPRDPRHSRAPTRARRGHTRHNRARALRWSAWREAPWAQPSCRSTKSAAAAGRRLRTPASRRSTGSSRSAAGQSTSSPRWCRRTGRCCGTHRTQWRHSTPPPLAFRGGWWPRWCSFTLIQIWTETIARKRWYCTEKCYWEEPNDLW